jgi:hypothetical protein
MADKQHVSMRIDGELWRRVRLMALEGRRSASSLVEDALYRWLDEAVRPAVLTAKMVRGVLTPMTERQMPEGPLVRDLTGKRRDDAEDVPEPKHYEPMDEPA